MDHARAKLERKGCDLLVVNDVSEGRVFNAADSEAVIIGADGSSRVVPPGPKSAIAHAVWDSVVALPA
jgi:phosphopantothenoylcysteine decarboxylase/phosphopantothenate--cysteine ligase